MNKKQKNRLVTSEFALSLAMLVGALAFIIGLLPAINPGLCNVSFTGDAPLSHKAAYIVLCLAGFAMITCAHLVQKRNSKDDKKSNKTLQATRD